MFAWTVFGGVKRWWGPCLNIISDFIPHVMRLRLMWIMSLIKEKKNLHWFHWKTDHVFPGCPIYAWLHARKWKFVFFHKQLASCFPCIPYWQMESLSLMSVLSLSSWHISMSLMSWCYTSAKPLMTSLSPLLSSTPLWKNRGKLKWCVWIMDPMTRPPLWSSSSLFLKQSY